MERNMLLHFLSHQKTNELLVALGAGSTLVCFISWTFNHCKYVVYESTYENIFL
jgi:hypothetical protein